MAVSFAGLFLLLQAVAGALLYTGLEGVLWRAGRDRMEGHLHAVLQDRATATERDPVRVVLHLPEPDAPARPGHLPERLEEDAEPLAGALASTFFDVLVLDAQGRVLASAGEHPLAPASAATLAQLRVQGDPVPLQWLDSQGRQVLLTPLERQGRLLGYAQMASSFRFEEAVLRAFAAVLAGVGLLLALLTALAGVLLARALAQPLERVASTATRVAGGDLAARTGLPAGRNEIYAVAAAFDRMAARLEESFAIRRRFLADASHELKTPLTALQGLGNTLRLLDRDDLDPDRRRTLEAMDGELGRMERLVADLLVLARAEEVREPAREAVEVRELLPEVAVEGEPVWLLGDKAALGRALRNLVDNARRHAPGATVRVTARCLPEEVRVEVADDGPGIAPEHLPWLGQRFYRPDGSRARGTGLGLSIARAVAEQHGGRLEIESQVGRGTRVTLVLPRVELE